MVATVVGLLFASTLVVTAGIVAGHGSVSVGFTTETVAIDSGAKVQVDVVVDRADDGVDTYDLSLSTDSEAVVAITDASVSSGTATVTVGPNGSRLNVSASGLARDGPTVEALTLTLAARSNGTETLSIDAASVLPPAGAPYLTTERGTVDVVVGADDTTESAFGTGIVLAGSTVVLLLALVAYAVARRR
ncbi:hypothetical protein DV733_13675 [Halapricum salinum]|uniref:Cohesin domain-containing protein n=2 Tax=Halapricum salinum TaxID=1457250 RepID=A0A4D6HFB3_9EURY|nr:hypothetical protein DV733_13675 [Halapricum salinum]